MMAIQEVGLNQSGRKRNLVSRDSLKGSYKLSNVGLSIVQTNLNKPNSTHVSSGAEVKQILATSNGP